VMPDPCPDCGKDRVLVGYRHLCVPVSANANVEEASRRSTLAALERHHASRVTPATQLNQALTRVAELEAEVKQLKRQLAKRLPVRQGRVSLTESNAQFDRKSYQREYMRKHRAKSKVEKRK
jgi:uncharacterized protein YigA (DUF484 family)